MHSNRSPYYHTCISVIVIRRVPTLHLLDFTSLYDKDWDDYINVDESEIESKCPNRAKLKVYVVSTLPKNIFKCISTDI